ncbi:MAG: hypothetical protein HY900_01985, partial [Deltaproteobacteria bacterium]|nr:hypothetical protein [Deltaproteobacteria bacterium]
MKKIATKVRFSRLLLGAAALLVAAPSVRAEEIKVIGGTAATAKVKVHKAEIEKATGATLTLVAMGGRGG